MHNLGPSKLVLADLATGERLREIEGVGNKAHGLVPWDGGFLILNSGEGQSQPHTLTPIPEILILLTPRP